MITGTLTARPVAPEEVASFAAGLAALPPEAERVRTAWRDSAAVQRSLQEGRTYYAYPGEVPVCVFSITPAKGGVELEAAVLRFLGALRVVPREALPGGPLRTLVGPDRLVEIAHLHAREMVAQYQRDLLSVPAMPAGVQVWDAPRAFARPLWHALWQDHRERSGSGDSHEAAAAEAERELALPGARWFSIGDYAVAKSGAVGSTQLTLSGCFVAPEYRGRHLQRALIRARLADGYARGFRAAVSQVAPFNESSRAHLVAEGFTPANTLYLIP